MPEESIKTGIYLNPQTNFLYFVVGLIDNKDIDKKSVFYFPLYEKSNGCCRSLDSFFEKASPPGRKTTRMSLLVEMDARFKDYFIIGSEVYMPEKHVVSGGGMYINGQALFMFVREYDQREIAMALEQYSIWLPK